ncbi:MAG: hypothetical protein IKZ46_17185 [Victivallales bacterium]|nr:hypothetical protein [Victivallales bacterium]
MNDRLSKTSRNGLVDRNLTFNVCWSSASVQTAPIGCHCGSRILDF